MIITIDITPQEAKDMMTPGPNQITMYSEMTAAFTKAWFDTMGQIQKNAWQLPSKTKG